MADYSVEQTTRIPAGEDRFGEHRRVLGSMSIDFKVSASDTNGGLFVVENTDRLKGGPPRHLHHEQEEWFYVVQSEYVVEIGESRHLLGPGDSVLAPRKVPHVWAHVGESTGRLLVAFHPARQMEAFFTELAKLESPSRETLHELFGSHGMQVTGPPLAVE